MRLCGAGLHDLDLPENRRPRWPGCLPCKWEADRERRRRRAVEEPEKVRAEQRAKRAAKPEVYRAHTERWRRDNLDVYAEKARRNNRERQARIAGAEVVEKVDPLVVLEIADGECGICGGDVDPLSFHVDHIVPVARGGEHSYANTQPAHPRCNIEKGIG